MKILLPGGTGQIGRVLAAHFTAAGHEVVTLTRDPAAAADREGERSVHWDGRTLGPWASEFEGAGAVVNLAGRSVNCRYHARNRAAIVASRLDSTRAVGEAILKCETPPPVWLQSSTATIYEHAAPDAASGEAARDESFPAGVVAESHPDTWHFSAEVATGWEAAAAGFQPRLDAAGVRLVLLRSAMVMDPAPGGVFAVLRNLVRRGLGGTQGSGAQWVSWIHHADFAAALDRLIADETLSGPVNLASPNPVRNRELMRALREAAGVPFGLPAPVPLLELGAAFLRTESELILKSRRVIPGKLRAAGFEFRFPDWPAAARGLCGEEPRP